MRQAEHRDPGSWSRFQIAVAVVYCACFMVPWSVRYDVGEMAAGGLFVLLPPIAGLLIGRWSAIGLVVAPLVSFALLGDGCSELQRRDPGVVCDVEWLPLMLTVYLPGAIVLIAAGVVIHRVTRRTLQKARLARQL